MKNIEKIIFIGLLTILTVISRLIPHLPNFTPITAVSIFIFAYVSKRYFWIPILILLISDIFIGVYDIRLMLAVYLSFVLVGFLGYFLKNKRSILRILTVSLSGSVFFFLTTNFAVWIFSSWYEKDFVGLLNCYILGVPFFRNMILADFVYLFSFFYLSEYIVKIYKNPKNIDIGFLTKKIHLKNSK
mgnify:CR=1 FL=1